MEVPIGLLSNGTDLRLMYAPRGENAGSLTFPVAAMAEIAGRLILGAFHLLLSRYRLLAAPREGRLPALLQRSRDYQASVSTALAGQVLDALYELLRGFEHADAQSGGRLLVGVLAHRPDDLYSALLTVLMRLVFVLFAEDRDLLPSSELYRRGYSVHGLFERLRADAELYPDTLDLRYGATPHLIPTKGLLLQPTDERRRSGSHYTPRALTEPIVRKTLSPILERLGTGRAPAQILDLKVCDMAVGSGAFLVETCRQLGDALVEAWRIHGGRHQSRRTKTKCSSLAVWSRNAVFMASTVTRW